MQMSFPRVLRLVSTKKGMRLAILPAEDALAAFRVEGDFQGDFEQQIAGCAYACVKAGRERLTLRLGEVTLRVADGVLVGPIGEVALPGSEVDLRVMRDGPLLEVYAQDGLVSFAHPLAAAPTFAVSCQGGPFLNTLLMSHQI